MDGLNILNTIDFYRYEGFFNYFWIFLLIGFALVFLGIFLLVTDFDWIEIVMFIMGIGALGCAAGLVFCILSQKLTPNTYDHTEYEVTLSNGIDIEEFARKYEIIGQRGEIYTIKERENDGEE